MTDAIGAAISAAAAQSAWAPALAFAAGAVTSLGPCVAPRFVAIAALGTSPGVARWKAIGMFSAGLCLSYVALGVAGGALMRVVAISVEMYALLALALLVLGLRALWRRPSQHHCTPIEQKSRSSGSVFLLGTSFALVTSPCCTPVVVVLGALAAARSSSAFGALLIGAFALGHALPLAVAGFGWNWIGSRLDTSVLGPAAETVSGALMLALAGYYGALA